MGLSLIERDRRYSAIREKMHQDKLDSLIVAGRDGYMSRGNIRYITNYGIIAGEQYCVFRPDNVPVFISGKTPAAFRLSKGEWPLEIRTTSDPAAQAVKELMSVDKGNKVGIIGLQDISVPTYLTVREQFGSRLVDATNIFKQLRLIKSSEEIAKMRVSAEVADEVYKLVKDMVRPGLSGYEIYAEIKKTIIKKGCEYSFEIISTQGTSMNLFHPTGEKLVNNGILSLEMTPCYDGYFAQLPITIPVGSFSPPFHKILPVWKRALKEAVDILRPGAQVSDIYHAVTRSVSQAGFKSPWRPGHAIGLDMIDFWSISESNTTILQPGMTLAIHPNVMLDPEVEGIGIGAGYTYLITDSGSERLSKVEIFD
jgi:Xaa-Pro dipeptidase